jgi:hypothetical protein
MGVTDSAYFYAPLGKKHPGHPAAHGTEAPEQDFYLSIHHKNLLDIFVAIAVVIIELKPGLSRKKIDAADTEAYTRPIFHYSGSNME